MSISINNIKLNKVSGDAFLKVFMYTGNDKPSQVLQKAIRSEMEDKEYYEFMDEHVDNPWTRVIISDIESQERATKVVEGRKFDLYTLHDDGDIQVYFLSYAEGDDERPQPIVDLALKDLAGTRGYSGYIDVELSDIWSRLVIFGVNKMPQRELNTALWNG